MKSVISTTILLFALVAPAWGGALPFYEWKNETSGSIVCAQTAPDKGWVKVTGPYEDLKCTTRVKGSPSVDRKIAPKK